MAGFVGVSGALQPATGVQILLGIVTAAVFGKRLKRLLLPKAQAVLAQAQARGSARVSRS